MKAPLFLVLVLTFLIGCKTEEDFTMNTFINILQSSGNYTIIYNIKCIMGDDIAIEFCEEIEKTNLCKTLVQTYMECPKTQDKNIEQLIKLILERKNGIKILKRLYLLLLKYQKELNIKDLLKYIQNAIEKIEPFMKEKKIIFPDK